MSGMSPDDSEAYNLAGLAGLYALDALEGEELERFEALLATNAELREEVAGFRATTAELADLSAAEPPASLRANVLAAVSATRQDAPIVSLDAHREGRARRRALLGAVAAVAVLVAGFGGYIIAERSTSEPTSELASLLARPDTKVVTLTGVGSAEAAGRVVVSPTSNKVVIVSDTIPPPADGRTYELWRRDAEGALHKAGLFEPDADGRLEVALKVSLDDAAGFYVTDEPDGGSPQATTAPLMEATIE